MAKRKKKNEKVVKREPLFGDLSPHTKQAIGAVLLVALGAFFVLASLGYGGVAGDMVHSALRALLGYGFALAPIVCLLMVYVLMRPREDSTVSAAKITGVLLFFLSALGLLSLALTDAGGYAGALLLTPLHSLVGDVVAGIVLFAFVLVGIFLIFDTSFIHLFSRKEKEEDEDEEVEVKVIGAPTPEDHAEFEEEKKEESPEEKRRTLKEKIGIKKLTSNDFTVTSFQGTYAPPPLSLLSRDKGTPNVGDIKANANTIKRTLKKFNIDVEMAETTIGPTFTRYALKPAEGVKLGKILSLQTNLEFALNGSTIRIEAPIPGKSLVGIEVPNTERQTIGLATLFASPEFTDSPKPLLTVLGKNIGKQAQFADIARMPHGLIAGTTGSGKSVAIHNIVISLLYRNSPDQLRFIMVDPKLVELTLYNDIPHLLTPVITDAKRAIQALKWAIKEMDRRLGVLQENKVQNISSYHEKVYNPAKLSFEKKGSPEDERDVLPEPMFYIVIIIDELADLMSMYPKELEACIVRLAQKSRAAGIHLILSTQRPSVNVITGTIKANIPTRAALQVASQIDSRTILDQGGAEKLLGRGDMLFLSAESPKPIRLQSAFVSEDEVKRVVEYLKKQFGAEFSDHIDLDPSGKDGADSLFTDSLDNDEEEGYEEAKAVVIAEGKASTSLLQRKLRLGYGRAARIIESLEKNGVIGPADGSKPRQVLIGQDSESEET